MVKTRTIDDIPLGATALNGKTVGWDPAAGRRVWVDPANFRRQTYIYVPDPQADAVAELNGWLLSVIRSTPMSIPSGYSNIRPRATPEERKLIREIWNRARRSTAHMRVNGADDIFRKGLAEMKAMTRLAFSIKQFVQTH